MTKAKTEDECCIGPYWKVRVCLPGNILHFASRTKPIMRLSAGRVSDVDMDLITGTEHGDSIGFIDWPAVLAVTWRRT